MAMATELLRKTGSEGAVKPLHSKVLRTVAMWNAAFIALLIMVTAPRAAAVSPLFARGYTVLPTPQSVTLTGPDFVMASGWKFELGSGVKDYNVAVTTVIAALKVRPWLPLAGSAAAGVPGVIRFAIVPGSVAVGDATDHDRPVLAEQAYSLSLKPQSISIRANAAPGLFYGVETLIQLLRAREGWYLPQAEITDWPNLQLRIIYWDDAHHLEHLDVLKAAIRQAAFYKINGFAIKLEGHFQYQHAAPIVEPYALSPAELQELTDYGLRLYVQVIPYLDGPAHDAFILKHPEYAALREYPESNYEFCVTNPATDKLFYGMFDDLLEANKGSKYFVLSTDEPYYVGLAHNAQCAEGERAQQLGSVGKLLAEYVTRMAAYLHDRGRTVIFWGEYPLKPDDIGALPPYVVNGEVYGPDFDPVFRAHGIRQMIYTSTEGEERLFPDYYLLPSSLRLHPRHGDEVRDAGRVQEIYLQEVGDLTAAAQKELVRQIGWSGNGDAQRRVPRFICGTSASWSPRSRPASSAKTFIMESAEFVCGCLHYASGRRTFPSCGIGFSRPLPAIFAGPYRRSVPRRKAFFLQYNWPGNIRELKDAARAIVALGDETLAMGGLRSLLRRVDRGGNGEKISLKDAARAASREAEREIILQVLARTRWNRRRAAQELQISYKALLYKLKQIGCEEYGA